MNITRLTQVRKLFMQDMAPRSTVRHNMRAWVKSIRFLGNNWHLSPAKHIYVRNTRSQDSKKLV